jgi:hypothetical protein
MMRMATCTPEEICRRLGTAKTAEIFLELPTDSMKKIARESGASTQRSATTLSSKRRNESWAAHVTRRILSEAPPKGVAAALIYEWLVKARRDMLAAFLTSIEVENDHGLTERDFLKDVPADKLLAQGQALMETYPPVEVAAYLLFLDAANGTELFAELAGRALAPTPLASVG